MRRTRPGYHASVSPILDVLLHPDRRKPSPEPLRVDLRVVIVAGMVAWAIALAICAILAVADVVADREVAMCGTGLILGVAGLIWERSHRRSYRGD